MKIKSDIRVCHRASLGATASQGARTSKMHALVNMTEAFASLQIEALGIKAAYERLKIFFGRSNEGQVWGLAK